MDSSLSTGTGPRLGARIRQRISVRRVLRVITTTAGTLATLAFLGVGVVAPLLHIGFSPVLTGSMRPADRKSVV